MIDMLSVSSICHQGCVPTQIVPLPEVPTQALLRGQEISVDATQAQRHHFAHNTGCGKRAIARHA